MSYCRWSSRCENGKLSDVYAYLHCAGGVSVHLAGYRQRWWYDLLGRVEDWAMDLGGDSWHDDLSTPPESQGEDQRGGWYRSAQDGAWHRLTQDGSWYREPLRRIASWIRMPRIGKRWLWWPHWLSHYVLPLPSEEDRDGLSFAEAALFLETLRCKGWNVPEYAIRSLDEDDRADPDGWMKQESEA